jgi:hypothetical protein
MKVTQIHVKLFALHRVINDGERHKNRFYLPSGLMGVIKSGFIPPENVASIYRSAA